VVVPVYNSAEILPLLVARLQPVLEALEMPHELLLVNDGSRDHSWEAIRNLAANHSWIRGMCMMRNYGQHNALLAGIRVARFDLTVTMDDDLQNPPEEIPKLMELVQRGADVVYGTPEHEMHGLWRDIASQITKFGLQSTMGASTARKVSAFRAFRTRLREAFGSYRSHYVSIDVLLTWGTTRFAAAVVQHHRRAVGVSSYTLRKLMTHALNMMTGFSTVPLQVASYLGFLLTAFGVGVLGYVVIRYLIQGSVVPGFAFLACIVTIFSGTQLFALGVMGEYLARIHSRTMDRPPYCIRCMTDDSGA
jgi:glycosyltransferase involved in cell wall biosynthesis